MYSMMRTLVAAAGMSLLVGCAATATNTNISENHPANPGAAEAPLPAPSNTLALDPSSTPSTPADDAELGMQHNGMQHDMAGMSHDTGGAASMQHEGHGMAHQMPATQTGENAAPSAARTTPTTGPTASGVIYTCPMHKEVVSDRPGKCPKCGMKLVAKQQAGQAAHSQHGGHQ